jgi:hypothetical protein
MAGPPSNKPLVVMISSTARDLPEHRKQLIEACLRQSILPKMMEHLAAEDVGAVAKSQAMIDEADIYLGIFAFRYGTVPKGYKTSITQMEYERAIERGIPRLIFLMGDDHPVKPGDVETGPGAKKLERLKKRLRSDPHIINEFHSPDDLRANAINSLGEVKRRLEAKAAEEAAREGKSDRDPALSDLHYVSDIPALPEPYIAHPYTLLQTRGLIGRQEELDLLTDWIARPEPFHHARILSVVAIGGMGKSALTWHWFNSIAPQEMAPLAGRMWWSFYESDASFENFVARALAYASGQSEQRVWREVPSIAERESRLLAILDRQPFLITLDGLERILVAYARMDAAYRPDTDLDDETANRVAGALGLPASAGQTFIGHHPLRRTADPRVGQFLRKLARVRASRILVSSRLYPADLQTATGDPLPDCAALFLAGLGERDALDLWRAFGAKGSREVMLPVFRTFDSHPLLIQILAGEVANFHSDPGNFDAWHATNPDFDPFALPLVQVQSHVLTFALAGLTPAERRTLHVIAGFRMPAGMDTLKSLLIGATREGREGRAATGPQPRWPMRSRWKARPLGQADPGPGPDGPFASLSELDVCLTTLEDRGLLGWDRRANRYDLHPIVRGVTWNQLDEATREDIYATLHRHFQALPTVEFDAINSLEDLTPAIELYNTLIGLGRHDDALVVYRERLHAPLLFRLNANRQRVELVEQLFANGVYAAPFLSRPEDQSYALNALALAYQFVGLQGKAVQALLHAIRITRGQGASRGLGDYLINLSDASRLSGGLRSAEASARASLLINRAKGDLPREAVSLLYLCLVLARRGAEDDRVALQRAIRIADWLDDVGLQRLLYTHGADRHVWVGDPAAAQPLADLTWNLALGDAYEAARIEAARLQGAIALLTGRPEGLATADERLHYALTQVRNYTLYQEELPILVNLAELHLRRSEPERAREMLADVWEPAERGPYPLFHADALNVLAQIERDAGDRGAAAVAATRAFELAWCDGPPFAYHWGLVTAQRHLAELGAPEPDLPPFDEATHDPMPEVEIDPPDAFSARRTN